MCYAACTTPGTKPRRNAWLVSSAIWRRKRRQTKLALARKKLKKTQQDLAYESGVSLRSIQMYEQRQRNINEASVTSVRAIAKALHCNIEDLLEPVFEYKEPSAA